VGMKEVKLRRLIGEEEEEEEEGVEEMKMT
jgi:hypothetical protein